MSFRIAWDDDVDNPNPHARSVESVGYESEEKARAAADAELVERRDVEGYREDELPSYSIVEVPGVAPLSGVYVVQVGPNVSDDPVRWCFIEETDADDFAKGLEEAPGDAWVTFEPIAASLSDPLLVDAFPDAVARAKEIQEEALRDA